LTLLTEPRGGGRRTERLDVRPGGQTPGRHLNRTNDNLFLIVLVVLVVVSDYLAADFTPREIG
jgi:hypothetical protein